MAGSCEDSTELSKFLKLGEFLAAAVNFSRTLFYGVSYVTLAVSVVWMCFMWALKIF